MATELSAQVVLEEGMRFAGASGSEHTVTLDGLHAGSAGPSPMELVLIGLAGCSAMDVVSILRKQHQPLQGLEVRARGQRRDEPPRIFTEIHLEYIVHGIDVDPTALVRAIDLSEQRYCSVWAMLVHSATIDSSWAIVE